MLRLQRLRTEGTDAAPGPAQQKTPARPRRKKPKTSSKRLLAKKVKQKIWQYRLFVLPLQPLTTNGTLAERLGNGLQNRVEQFDSARYLLQKRPKVTRKLCFRPSLIFHSAKRNDPTTRNHLRHRHGHRRRHRHCPRVRSAGHQHGRKDLHAQGR